MTKSIIGGMKVGAAQHSIKHGVSVAKLPSRVVLPLPSPDYDILVSRGDTVAAADVIAESQNGGCPLYSSISGTVGRIMPGESIEIVSDGCFCISDSVSPYSGVISDLSAADAIERLRKLSVYTAAGDENAAIVPLYTVLQGYLGKIDSIAVNCAGGERWFTANENALCESPEAVIGGLKILMRILSAENSVIAVGSGMRYALFALSDKKLLKGVAKVVRIGNAYPSHDAHQLIYALTGSEVPLGCDVSDAGWAVFDVRTCIAVYNAFVYGLPQIERVITVSGDCVRKPADISVPVGMLVGDVLHECGGLKTESQLLISGKGMRGREISEREPVTFSTDALLAFSKDPSELSVGDCVYCGRCAEVCAYHLSPYAIAKASAAGKYDRCVKYHIDDCAECGACTYICPTNSDPLGAIRTAKAAIAARNVADSVEAGDADTCADTEVSAGE